MRFEYKVMKIKATTKDTESALMESGREGWELVCSYAENSEHLILKRPAR